MIAWVDIETSGSDEESDELLEVGIVLTDDDLNEIARSAWVVHPYRAVSVLRTYAPDVVRNMHDANGLWIDACEETYGKHVVDDWINDWLDGQGVSSEHIPLAGSGVAHFDGRWIRKHLPKFGKRLTYWSYDVGVVRRFLRLAGREDLVLDNKDDKPHRALDDILLRLDEGRHYLQTFGSLVTYDEAEKEATRST